MRRCWRSLRVRLALLGFLAGYAPVLLLFGVVLATDTEVTSQDPGGAVVVETTRRGSAAAWTVPALAPVVAGLAWWWAGRAVRPIDRVRTVADDIQGADLSRRISLAHGPTEVAALAGSFDAMLDRLEQAADTQRRLVEEASHELRVPLAVLITNADVLLDHPAPTAELYRRGLERSRDAALRLHAVLDELLVDARGRARTIDRRPADLAAIVRAVAGDVDALAATRGTTVTVAGAATAVCAIDEPTVRRAVHNLVDNAVRHCPGGTAVRVTVELSASEAAVVVTDDGPGIPEAEQDGVFHRFRRGTTDAAGTGLGLAIARQVAVAHGGTLTLTSPTTTAAGCTFRLTLRR